MIRTILILILLSHGLQSLAQQSKIDSVSRLLELTADKNQKGGLLIFRSKSTTPISVEKAREDAQQALSYYQETGNIEGQIDAYLQFSGLYSRESKYKLALDVDSITYKLSKQQQYKKGIAISLSNMGRNLQQVGDMQKAKKALLESNVVFMEAGMEKETSEIKNRLGVLYRKIGDFKNSMKNFDEAMEVAKRFNLTNSMANIYMNRANTLDESSHFDEAIKDHLESIRIREKMKDERGLAQNYNNLANVYTHTGLYMEALQYYQRARNIAENMKPLNKTSLALAYNNLANGYMAVEKYDSIEILHKKAIALFQETGERPGLALIYHDLGGYHLNRKNFTESLNYLYKALEIRKGSMLVNDEASTRNLIGVVLGKLNRPIEAEQYLLRSLAMVNNKSIRLQEEIYHSLANHYGQTGDYEKASEYQSKYFNLKDTLFTESEAMNMVKEKSNYELEKKDAALLLSQKEKQFDSLKIKDRNKTITLLGTGLVLLTIIIGMSVYNNRQKQKTASALAVKNNKIETLVRELHHRVKNNLQVVSGLLALQSNRLEDETAKQAMDAGRSRVDAMALIHQKLYLDKDLASVDIKEYIENLSASLAQSYGYTEQTISTAVKLDNYNVDVDRAIPIGLIINELVTNAFKHAFTNTEKPSVKVVLENAGNNVLELAVSDNGNGIVTHEKPAYSFGMKLVHTLVEQLNGTIASNFTNGTAYTIRLNSLT